MNRKKTYHVTARKIGWEADIEARNPMKAVGRACIKLAENLPAEFVSRNPLTVRCVDDAGRVLFARNVFHRCPDGAVKSTRTAEFRVD